jgi:multidrug efflux pump subunit AcrA (membrane-fusion protein)
MVQNRRTPYEIAQAKVDDANAALIIARNRLAERRAAYEKTQAEVDRLDRLVPLLEQIRDAEKGDDDGPAVVEVTE